MNKQSQTSTLMMGYGWHECTTSAMLFVGRWWLFGDGSYHNLAWRRGYIVHILPGLQVAWQFSAQRMQWLNHGVGMYAK